jgi:hypothetical protein
VKWPLSSLKLFELCLYQPCRIQGEKGPWQMDVSAHGVLHVNTKYMVIKKRNILDVCLSSSLHYLQGIPKYFWISEVCLKKCKTEPQQLGNEIVSSDTFPSLSEVL